MKKVLAWAVALALVLSSFTMAFAADAGKTSKDFSDADQIHYTEAVDVMVATGIINGFPDGTFGPQKTVKRSEMAKMIACIMNGGEDVGDQYKSACPFADSKDHWAAGYIAYCASEHIIDGRSADVFDPEATVTGTEVAKMALTSLGYDSGIQGYTGENWATNVLKDAKKNNLFKGLDKSFVPGDPCNRESAAQILFNMLKAPMVEYDTNTSVTVGDATVTVNSKVNKIVADEERDPKTGEPLEGETGYVELYEEVFGGDLELDEAAGDDFGNPGHTWTYEDETVGTYTDTPAYDFTAEDEGFAAALKAYNKDLAKSYEKDKLVINSVTVNGDSTEEGIEDFVAELPGTGDTVKMYEATVDEPAEGVTYYDIVIEKYFAVQIDKVDTDVDEDAAEEGISAYIDLKANGRTFKAEVPNTDIVGYNASTYVEGAVIAIAPNYAAEDTDDPWMIDSYVMDELANGVVGETNTTKGTVTIDGTEYEYASSYVPVDGVTPDVEMECTLYDYNGFALTSVKTADPESVIEFGVLEAVGSNKTTFGSTGAVKVFTAEGKDEVFDLNKKATGVPTNVTSEDDSVDDILIAYTFNEDEEIDVINNFDEITEGQIGTPAEGTTAAVGEKLKTNNVLKVASEEETKNIKVSDDVVVFWNKAEADEAGVKASEYEILGLSDLAKADSIVGECFIKDKEVVAIKLAESLNKEEEPEKILGFVIKTESIKDTEGQKQRVTALVDGKEVIYTTEKGKTNVATPDDALVEFEVINDTVLKAVKPANTPASETGDLVTEFADNTVGVSRTGTVNDIDGSDLNLGSADNLDYQTAGDIVYYNNNGTLEISSFNKIKAGCDVTLYQIKADATAWNIVVWEE